MRNVFIEGVRSAFVRIIRMIVYIILGLIIFYVIGLFTTKKVHALVYKGQNQDYTFSTYNFSNTVASTNVTHVASLTPNNPITKASLGNVDLLALTYNSFNISHDMNIVITNSNQYCSTYRIDHQYPCSSDPSKCILYNQMVCTATSGSSSSSSNVIEGDVTIIARVYYQDGSNSQCFFDDTIKDQIMCPTNADSPIIDFRIYITQKGFDSVAYDFRFTNLFNLYNYDATDIVNALLNVQTFQQQTTTVIQQQTTIMQDSSTTQSTTQATNSFTIMSNEITQQLSGLDDLTQVVLAPISLFVELATDTCSPIVLTVPFVNYQATLPCMKPIFNQYFSGLYTVFTTAISAIITYWVSVKTLSLIKDILDCDNDRIEVIDL